MHLVVRPDLDQHPETHEWIVWRVTDLSRWTPVPDQLFFSLDDAKHHLASMYGIQHLTTTDSLYFEGQRPRPFRHFSISPVVVL